MIGNALVALKQVVLLQDRVERIEARLETMADDLKGMTAFTHDLDKRLYAVERIVDLGARQTRRPMIEEQ
jgi:DNA anti-recombination protein RmuC